jgi:predicted ferric reductase
MRSVVGTRSGTVSNAASSGASSPTRAHPPRPSPIGTYELKLVLFLTLLVATGMWLRHDALDQFATLGGAFIGLGQISSLYATVALLAMMMLTARVPWIERAIGMDLLNHWHRWAAIVTTALIGVHLVASTIGYAFAQDGGIVAQVDEFLVAWPDMVTAFVGTALFFVVAITSARVARRAMTYEVWWLVHLVGYVAVVLSFFHEISTGVDLLHDTLARRFWIALHVAVAACVLVFRWIQPIMRALRHRLRIAEMHPDSGDVVTITLRGRRMDQLPVAAGQFFLLRFLDRSRWWKAHPYSLSAAPDGSSLRFTIKALGDDSSAVKDLPVGTRVVAEGPYGRLSPAAATRTKVALIGGGIGIAPIRAIFEDLDRAPGDVTVLYRARRRNEAPLLDEIEQLAASREQRLVVSYSREHDSDKAPFSPENLLASFPGLLEHDVFLCGPAGLLAGALDGLRSAGVPPSQIHYERFAY